MRLSKTQIESYRRDGFLRLPGLFSAAEVAGIRAEIERVADLACEEVRREAEDGPPKAIMHMHTPESGTASLALQSMVRLPRTLDVAKQLLGDDELYVHHTKMNLKAAVDGSVWPWHQDYGYWRFDGIQVPDMTTVMVMIDPSTELNGCLYLLPGSQADGRHEPVFDRSTSYALWTVPREEMRERLRRHGPPVAITGAPGDAVVFDCNLMHASAHNLSAENRWQAYLCYNTCANRARTVDKPRPEWVRGTDFRPLTTIDDRSLLVGGGRSA